MWRRQVEAWCEGKDNNIRALLGSLDIILWEGARWKPINIGVVRYPQPSGLREGVWGTCLIVKGEGIGSSCESAQRLGLTRLPWGIVL